MDLVDPLACYKWSHCTLWRKRRGVGSPFVIISGAEGFDNMVTVWTSHLIFAVLHVHRQHIDGRLSVQGRALIHHLAFTVLFGSSMFCNGATESIPAYYEYSKYFVGKAARSTCAILEVEPRASVPVSARAWSSCASLSTSFRLFLLFRFLYISTMRARARRKETERSRKRGAAAPSSSRNRNRGARCSTSILSTRPDAFCRPGTECSAQ